MQDSEKGVIRQKKYSAGVFLTAYCLFLFFSCLLQDFFRTEVLPNRAQNNSHFVQTDLLIILL